jgi:hypothetical protein
MAFRGGVLQIVLFHIWPVRVSGNRASLVRNLPDSFRVNHQLSFDIPPQFDSKIVDSLYQISHVINEFHEIIHDERVRNVHYTRLVQYSEFVL